MIKNCIYILMILLSIPMLIFAEQDALFNTRGTGGRGSEFLNSPFNAYGVSTGSILTVFGESADSVFWNPACLAQIENAQLQFGAAKLPYGRYNSYANFSKPFGETDNNAFGVTAMNSFDGGIDFYNNDDEYLRKGQYMGNALMLTYAKPVSIINFGVNAKVVNEIADKTKAFGGSLDIGMLISLPFPPLSLGLTLVNLPGFIKWDNEDKADKIASGYRIGFGYEMINQLKLGFVFGSESTEEEMDFNIGCEYYLASMFTIRLGLYKGNFAGGAGLHLGLMDVSYAYYNERFLEIDNSTHLMSTTFNF